MFTNLFEIKIIAYYYIGKSSFQKVMQVTKIDQLMLVVIEELKNTFQEDVYAWKKKLPFILFFFFLISIESLK